MVKSCCICKLELGTVPDVSIHSLPKNENLKAKWFVNIGREVSKSSGVCSQHFESEFMYYKVVENVVKRFLKPEVIPTLILTVYKSDNVLKNNTDCDTNCDEALVCKNLNPLESRSKLNIESNISVPTLIDVTNISAQENAQKEVKNKDQNMDDTEENNLYSENISNSEYHESGTSECSNLPLKTSVKRKAEEYQERKKKCCNPRFLGDLSKNDFTNESSWRIIQKHILECKKRQKLWNQKFLRLNTKIENLKSLLDHLKKSGLITNEGFNALDVSDESE